jgi:hypothetical protein
MMAAGNKRLGSRIDYYEHPVFSLWVLIDYYEHPVFSLWVLTATTVCIYQTLKKVTTS